MKGKNDYFFLKSCLKTFVYLFFCRISCGFYKAVNSTKYDFVEVVAYLFCIGYLFCTSHKHENGFMEAEGTSF